MIVFRNRLFNTHTHTHTQRISSRLRRFLPALALTACTAVLLTVPASAATPRELADEYCYHTNAAWCVDKDGDGTRESAPQLHPRFTEEGIEHLREHGRYYDPNDVVEPDPTPTPAPTAAPVPTPAPTAAPTPAPSTVSVSNLDETSAGTGQIIGEPDGSGLIEGANAFTTGPNSGGYTLTSVTAQFRTTSDLPGNIRVAIHAASGGNPAATAQVTLTGSNPASNSQSAYTCSGNGCALNANTTYFVVISAPTAPFPAYYAWDSTSSDDQTLTPSGNGWSLADGRKSRRENGSWTDVTSALMFEVEATTR